MRGSMRTFHLYNDTWYLKVLILAVKIVLFYFMNKSIVTRGKNQQC